MRIAIANISRRQAGGVESYLAQLIPALTERGHAAALWVEEEGAMDRPPISLPDSVTQWSAAELGARASLEGLRRWHPDVVYVQGLMSAQAEADLLKAAGGGVYYAHVYHGTCVSGVKAFHFPGVRPCHRIFGPGCLVNYFPRRCGGLNPVTMLKMYSLHAQKLKTLAGYQAIAVNSEHMAEEYRRHGLGARTRLAPLPSLAPEGSEHFVEKPSEPAAWNLLFLGRMEKPKGGGHLLDALPSVLSALRRPIRLTLAGDGRERSAWEEKARRLVQRCSALEIHFVGWADEAAKQALFENANLLVVPSLWPEPFGLAGVEAGHYGVPAAAFAVGGIPDWLKDGVNGALAPGAIPTPYGLADAIRRCLADPRHHARLRQGARMAAAKFSMENHLSLLLPILESAAR